MEVAPGQQLGTGSLGAEAHRVYLHCVENSSWEAGSLQQVKWLCCDSGWGEGSTRAEFSERRRWYSLAATAVVFSGTGKK